jgi:predicted membrane protein
MSKTLVPLLTLAAIGFTGCARIEEAGPMQHETANIELDKSEILKLDVRLAVGELKVSGGAKKLVEAAFDYNVPSWKPEVSYSATGFRGTMRIEQREDRGASLGGNQKCTWDILVNDSIPTDFDFKFGVGEATLNLATANIRSLTLNMGVGEANIDLRGKPAKDYNVEVRGGVGEATIRLPKDVAVVAEAKGGIGGIEARGLQKDGDRYVNDAYRNRTSPVTVRLDVRGGVGSINLIAE